MKKSWRKPKQLWMLKKSLLLHLLQPQATCWKVPIPEPSFLHLIHQRKLVSKRLLTVCIEEWKKQNFFCFQEKNLVDMFSLASAELSDFLDDDSQCPVSSSDPMLSSPAPSTLSSSPSSLYSSDENLSPQSMDHLVVWPVWSLTCRRGQ